MNDPLVVAVVYDLTFEDDVKFTPPSKGVSFPGSDFNIEIEGTKVRLLPINHFSDRQSARAAADRLARSWEVLIGLEVGTTGVRLVHEKTEIVDRNPTPGVIELHSEIEISMGALGAVSLTRGWNRYPTAPDPTFDLTLDAEVIWQRYRMYKEGREPLLSMGYAILTTVKTVAGGEEKALKSHNIDSKVFSKIGDLTANRGDKLSARKFLSKNTPLKPEERAWLEKAIEKLIIQVGRSKSGPPVQRLTMNDLPPL